MSEEQNRSERQPAATARRSAARQMACNAAGAMRHTVAGAFAVPAAALAAPRRGRARIAFARQVAMYLAHVGWGLSLTEVGRLFSRDRTTVAHACRTIEDRRDDALLDRVLTLLEAVVRMHARTVENVEETR